MLNLNRFCNRVYTGPAIIKSNNYMMKPSSFNITEEHRANSVNLNTLEIKENQLRAKM